MMFDAHGLIIDKEKQRFKTYISFLGFKFGEWLPLRKFTFVATTKRKGAQKMNSARTMGNSSTVTFPLYCVYLCVDKNRKILVLKSKKKQEAMNLSKGVSEYLNIDWINYIKED